MRRSMLTLISVGLSVFSIPVLSEECPDLNKRSIETALRRSQSLAGCDFIGADLVDVDFSSADLRGANFFEANLSWTNFFGADLRGANLSGATLIGAAFRGAKLAEANLYRVNLHGTSFGDGLMHAQISQVLYLSQHDLDLACGNDAIQLPDRLKPPVHWSPPEDMNRNEGMKWAGCPGRTPPPLGKPGSTATQESNVAGEPIQLSEEQKRGAALISMAVEAIGGAERLSNVRAWQIEATTVVNSADGERQMHLTATIALPDRVRRDVAVAGTLITSVLNGDDAFRKTAQGTVRLVGMERQSLKENLYRNPLVLLTMHVSGTLQILDYESGEIDGRTVEWVYVKFDGYRSALGIDPNDGKIIGIEYYSSTGAPRKIRVVYSEYRKVEGLMLSFASESIADGESRLKIDVESIFVNPDLSVSNFELSE